MSMDVILTICGRQSYEGQEPDTIELVTEGVLERKNGAWEVWYEESDLTGLSGTRTTFRLEEDKVTLTRAGQLSSEMIFQEGVRHDSLYQMEFGALMIGVCARNIHWVMDETGGDIRILYGIEIEQSTVGTVEYQVAVRPAA